MKHILLVMMMVLLVGGCTQGEQAAPGEGPPPDDMSDASLQTQKGHDPDNCPNDPHKTEPGICGCGFDDVIDENGNADCPDTDGDGTFDGYDGCPNDANKIEPGICGCGVAETDTDGDGEPDCIDVCPADANKTSAGICGCGVPDTDSDSDGTPDCNDQCPGEADKSVPGQCGCSIPDTDSDGDGVLDCNDLCPNDPNKTEPEDCGCDVVDDADGDGTSDCLRIITPLEDTQRTLSPAPAGPITFAPITLRQLVGPKSIAVGFNHTCAVKHTGSVWCWGKNNEGQLGNGNTQDSSTPVPVIVDGTYIKATAITVGKGHTCALKTDGTVWCWGRGVEGQLGFGAISTFGTDVPREQVTGLSSVIAISAGDNHTCAISVEPVYGSPKQVVSCWGSNAHSALGIGNTTVPFRASPTFHTQLGSTVDVVDCSGNHACVVTAEGYVYCWGDNDQGQLGDNTTDEKLVPTRVRDSNNHFFTGATKVATGSFHTCAIKSSKVWCWGANRAGQLGNDSDVTGVTAPVEISMGNAHASSITAGGLHSCMILTDGLAQCWGSNVAGQLGTNSSAPFTNMPVLVPNYPHVSMLAAGGHTTCGIQSDGKLQCWGSNGLGQLGNGTNINSNVPVPVTGF